MTTPVVRKSVTWEKTGATFEVSPVGPSVNVSRMRINSMIRSSVYLFTVRRRDLMGEATHVPDMSFAIVKYTVRCSNSTRHFHSSHFSPGFHSANGRSLCTSQHTTLPRFVAQRV